MKSGNIYSVNDKGISDAINQSKVTKADVNNLFYSRGIIVSAETNRKSLADYFSMFIHDYYDYQKLAQILGTHNRKDKSTVSYIPMDDITFENVETAANELNEKLGDFDATSHINRHGDTIEIVLNYRVVNFNKSEFRQVDDRESAITLSIENEKLCIRSPHEETVKNIEKILLSTIEENTDKKLVVERINLEGVSDPIKRTEFFEKLVNGLDGLDHYDVTDVFIYHPKNVDDNKDYDEDNSSSEKSEGTVDLGVHITKASLKGEKVLQSEELSGLYEKGFYIWKIVWHSKSESYDSDIYEFEAQFSNPDSFTDFSYLCRGFYRYKEGGAHNVSKTGFSKQQEKELGKKIETSALKSVDSILNSLRDGEDNEEG